MLARGVVRAALNARLHGWCSSSPQLVCARHTAHGPGTRGVRPGVGSRQGAKSEAVWDWDTGPCAGKDEPGPPRRGFHHSYFLSARAGQSACATRGWGVGGWRRRCTAMGETGEGEDGMGNPIGEPGGDSVAENGREVDENEGAEEQGQEEAAAWGAEDEDEEGGGGSAADQKNVVELVYGGYEARARDLVGGRSLWGQISEKKIIDLDKRMRALGLERGDIKEEFVRGSGRGGQKMNKTSSKVRVTHLPTGLQAASQAERQRTKNRFIAMRLLVEQLESARGLGKTKAEAARDKARKAKARSKKRSTERKRQKDEGEGDAEEPEAADGGVGVGGAGREA